MSFIVQRSGRGRQRVVRCCYGNQATSNRADLLRVPGKGADLAGLLGVPYSPDRFYSATSKSGNIGVFPTAGSVFNNNAFFGKTDSMVARVIGTEAFRDAGAFTSLAFSTGFENKSFAVFACFAQKGDAAGEEGRFVSVNGAEYISLYPAKALNASLAYVSNSSATGFCYCGTSNRHGGIACALFGWDTRTKKVFGAYNGSKTEGASNVSIDISAFVTMRDYFMSADGCACLYSYASWNGESAEFIADNIVAIRSNVDSLSVINEKHAVSSSAVATLDTVYNANSMSINGDGLIVAPAVTNLIANSNSKGIWTPVNTVASNYLSVDTHGIRSLFRIAETAVDDEHKMTLAVTPLATGKHWLEFTSRMSATGIDACAITIDNGTDSNTHSWDTTGAPTSYADDENTIVDDLGSGLFRLHVPITLTTLDPCTITLRGLDIYGSGGEIETVDSYEGTATKDAYAGQWSLVRSEKPPLAVPVSLGSSTTAIAPIIDWTDAKALNRLKNGRLSCKMRVQVPIWPAADVPLWTWRKDVNNGVEVRLVYLGTTDCRRQFGLSLVATQAGTTETVALDIGGPFCLEKTDDDNWGQRDLTVSVTVDSAGLARWVVRPEPDGEINIYEIANKQVGEQLIAFSGPLSTYAAPVPASIRLGSSVDGTGQQSMTIVEVETW